MRNFTQKHGKNIAQTIRDAMGKTFPGKRGVQELAAAVGVAPSTVTQWVNGRAEPSLTELYAMSRIFGIPFHRLCGMDDDSDSVDEFFSEVMEHVTAAHRRTKSRPSTAREMEALRLIRAIFGDMRDDACA